MTSDVLRSARTWLWINVKRVLITVAVIAVLFTLMLSYAWTFAYGEANGACEAYHGHWTGWAIGGSCDLPAPSKP